MIKANLRLTAIPPHLLAAVSLLVRVRDDLQHNITFWVLRCIFAGQLSQLRVA